MVFSCPSRAERFVSAVALVILLSAPLCRAQDVLLLRGHAANAAEESQARELVDFLGLRLQAVDVRSSADLDRELPRLRRSNVLAIIAASDALPLLHPSIQAELGKSNSSPPPLLVYGIDANTDFQVLRQWSGGALESCAGSSAVGQPTVLHVSSVPELTGTLSGLDLPAVSAPVCRIGMSGKPGDEIALATVASGEVSPVLVRTLAGAREVFFMPRLQPFDGSWVGQPWSLPNAFSSMAPLLLFLKKASGDYAWHLDGHYANLTIDDPWLIQPYGNLDYRGLFSEMERHNFHTTIAFVPWNYDRTDPQVADLFRNNPKRYSISLHGNNHAHREFGDYSGNSLAGQTRDIEQGVGRMERFQQLTGIPYDRFMVFPHGVAPQETFSALARHGFLGTANSLNVPLDAQFPVSPLFLLKPYTIAYGNLLSLSRYSVEAPLSHLDLAIQSFLGNPILLYAHQGFFQNGIGSFSPVADSVNRMEPDTQWVGLGEIARHSYETRLRKDGGFDIRMLSGEITVTNSTPNAAAYNVTLKDSSTLPVDGLSVDGISTALSRTGSTLALRLEIPAHQSRTLRAVSPNQTNMANADIGKKDMRVYALRQLSDFRDIYLSRHAWGRALVDQYYGVSGDSLELYLERKWWLSGVFAALGLTFLFRVLHRRRRRQRQLDALRAS